MGAILWLKKCGTTGFSCQKETEKKNEKKGKKRLTFWNTFAIIIFALKNGARLLEKSRKKIKKLLTNREQRDMILSVAVEANKKEP